MTSAVNDDDADSMDIRVAIDRHWTALDAGKLDVAHKDSTRTMRSWTFLSRASASLGATTSATAVRPEPDRAVIEVAAFWGRARSVGHRMHDHPQRRLPASGQHDGVPRQQGGARPPVLCRAVCRAGMAAAKWHTAKS